VTAGASLHWMTGTSFCRASAGTRAWRLFAIVSHDTVPDAWSLLGGLLHLSAGWRLRAFRYGWPAEQYGLFEMAGHVAIGPVLFRQPIDQCIESYHSRSGSQESDWALPRQRPLTKKPDAAWSSALVTRCSHSRSWRVSYGTAHGGKPVSPDG